MARLTRLKPALRTLAAPVAALRSDDEEARRVHAPWRAWYKTQRWRELSWRVRVEELFTCRRCGVIAAGRGETVADHIERHRGDPALFWDRRNLQCLCATCHSGAKQREEAQERRATPTR